MNCYVHPEIEASGMCTACGRPICPSCAVELQGRLTCRECLSTGRATAAISAPRAPKDRSMALILEILPGLFGFLGFGWIYAGNTSTGVAWLVGYLFWNIVAGIGIVITAGFGCLLTLPINVVLVTISAMSLSTYTKQHTELFGA